LIKVVICDDEENVLSTLSARIEAAFARAELDASIEAFSSVKSLLNRLETDSYDVFFLDIDMPEMDGVVFGERLCASGFDACIVFISNREERVYDTFKVAPLRFVRKSRFNEEIDAAAQAVKSWWEQRRNKYLAIVMRGQVYSFLIDDILYVECFDKVQNVVTKTQTKSIRATMNELEEKLLGHGFLSPYKGYLVNYRYIDSIEKSSVILQNGVVIPLSKHKITETKRAFLRLVYTEPDISTPRLHKP